MWTCEPHFIFNSLTISHVFYDGRMIICLESLIRFSLAQYAFFFENGTLPLLADGPEYTTVSPAELQTNMLLDNLSKIERM